MMQRIKQAWPWIHDAAIVVVVILLLISVVMLSRIHTQLRVMTPTETRTVIVDPMLESMKNYRP